MWIMRLSEALIDGFSLWLDSRTRAGFRPRNRMDPFETSLRGFNRVGGWLQEIRGANRITGMSDRATSQAYTDLKFMGLVVRPRMNDPILSPFGDSVISAWEDLGVADNDAQRAKEIARGAALIRLGMTDHDDDVRVKYTGMYKGWLTLNRLQPAEYWLNSFVIMLLPEYLDVADERGYNPFNVLVALNGGHLGNENDWDEWAADTSWQGHHRLAKMLDKLRVDNRAGGSTAFRQALHITYIARARPTELPGLLDDWNIPQ